VGTVNILEVITKYTEVEIKEEEVGPDTQLLQRMEGVIVDVPSPLAQLLRKWTADNMTGGLPINEETAHVPAIT